MHGKSGCFVVQNSRFRNAKAQLSIFKRIIFTKARCFYRFTIEFLEDSRKTRNNYIGGKFQELAPYIII
ncbi:hypothetical protein CUB97_10290 [Prevotella intermedia]|uniref:Uncharacterized protein n=1 Tax=Prevotella intermedia TaxID=28131 RepID=A0A2M8M3H2_PREIN|nr:hypothetical protein CUB97_10290 [Prevotella intermedia]